MGDNGVEVVNNQVKEDAIDDIHMESVTQSLGDMEISGCPSISEINTSGCPSISEINTSFKVLSIDQTEPSTKDSGKEAQNEESEKHKNKDTEKASQGEETVLEVEAQKVDSTVVTTLKKGKIYLLFHKVLQQCPYFQKKLKKEFCVGLIFLPLNTYISQKILNLMYWKFPCTGINSNPIYVFYCR